MAQPARSRKYVAASLICLFLGTQAAPLGNTNSQSAYKGGRPASSLPTFQPLPGSISNLDRLSPPSAVADFVISTAVPRFLVSSAASTLRFVPRSNYGANSTGVFGETLASSTISPKDYPTGHFATNGSIETSLPTAGEPSVAPFPTSIISTASGTIAVSRVISTAASAEVSKTPAGTNLFVEISRQPAPYMIGPKDDHPIAQTGIASSNIKPIETNKFYAGLFLANQTDPVWTHPYSIRWAKGADNLGSWGMAISHIEHSQVVYGDGDPAKYFVNPVGIDSLILSAKELGSATVLTTDNHHPFSVNANLAPSLRSPIALALPLVQGMGFVTGIYTNATPLIQSGVFFQSLSPLSQIGSSWKTKAILQDDTQWLIYISPSNPSASKPVVVVIDSQTVMISSNFTGMIQVAKLSAEGQGESIYDSSAGTYATEAVVTASLSGQSTASYSLSWSKQGLVSQNLIMFALPHHVQAFNDETNNAKTNITLQTTTKGIATAINADRWTMIEQLPISMGFAPWSPISGDKSSLPDSAMEIITSAASSELSEDFDAQTNLDSMYFSGKAMAKFAAVIYTTNDLIKNPGLAQAGLVKLKDAMATFIQNKQQTPLVYDTVWMGVVSSAGYDDIGADFGNTAYNDHHFHYGYFVYTAAVITHLDPSWATENSATNSAWVNALVRDYANSITDDPYYPFSRNFDWFHGHSWAKGLFESGAGKDQESSSEDSFASYALKMWGKASGDGNMEARGNLMLAIQSRTFANYFLMESTNTVQPARFIRNKVSGIMFESKVDHTTYFGTNIEYIEGIHMLPIMPNSGLTRHATFVREEWTQYFDSGRVDAVESGWRGILYANLALIDPVASWKFFADPGFDVGHLDGGASRTWYLAFAAALGGAG